MQGNTPVLIEDTVITSLDTTASKQTIHWWGEDQDGEVVGYYYKWNYQDSPTFTTDEYATFYVPIRQQYDVFEFEVYALDNDSALDPVPARLSFPVFNSKPAITFRNKSNPQANPDNPNGISYTFTTRTFVWDALDPDGNETVMAILWALDDTTEWNIIDRTHGVLPDFITLTNEHLTEGYHQFFVKAQDIAGAESQTIMFPDPKDNNVPNFWYVQEPRGSVLLIDDFAQDQISKGTQKVYTDVLTELYGENGFSVWEIGSTFGDNAINRENALPYTASDIVANMSYFDKVVWFSHLGRPHISEAGLSITKYVKNGGNIFISNGNEQIPDTTWTFTSIDSVYRLNPSGRLLPGVKVMANFDESVDDELTLELGQLIGNRVSALVSGKEEGVASVFNMEHPDSADVVVPYNGTPCVAVHYAPSYIEGQSIYFSLPLHYCYGRNNIKQVLEYILNEVFEN
ncbi:MAG: hypothetical protein JXQ65_01225 [Candidatus Marinimicrobia bacterium]|nr:hypothetical protein [Candidatus Neomarinimicrobiota bacterium]